MSELPRIVKVLSAVAVIYGVWLLEPRWITGAIGLLVLYALLTNLPRFTALVDSANDGLGTLFRPASSRSSGGDRPLTTGPGP